jgi:S-adenosylmethionine:tRNA ribosyltransferase-isomerase
MRLSEFDYLLPADLIAQAPLADRAASRMLVVRRDAGSFEDGHFRDLPSCLGPGDCLAINETRVFPARLFGRKPGFEREIELFLLKPLDVDRRTWRALARPGRRVHLGSRIRFTERLEAEVLEIGERGERTVRFEVSGDLDTELSAAGHVPLPPYIHRQDTVTDRERYQTVYARDTGSVAAPTAGLHFTPEVLAACRAAGATVAPLTLHVGLGTFQPLKEEEVEANRLHSERFEISEPSAALLASARRRVAVGTTAVRTLESVAREGALCACSGETDIFIYPGFPFRATGAMLTNFHLPKSSLLLLVAAFAGRELAMAAYRHAVEARYRFYSYGDCMLIL